MSWVNNEIRCLKSKFEAAEQAVSQKLSDEACQALTETTKFIRTAKKIAEDPHLKELTINGLSILQVGAEGIAQSAKKNIVDPTVKIAHWTEKHPVETACIGTAAVALGAAEILSGGTVTPLITEAIAATAPYTMAIGIGATTYSIGKTAHDLDQTGAISDLLNQQSLHLSPSTVSHLDKQVKREIGQTGFQVLTMIPFLSQIASIATVPKDVVSAAKDVGKLVQVTHNAMTAVDTAASR